MFLPHKAVLLSGTQALESGKNKTQISAGNTTLDLYNPLKCCFHTSAPHDYPLQIEGQMLLSPFYN